MMFLYKGKTGIGLGNMPSKTHIAFWTNSVYTAFWEGYYVGKTH